MDAPIDVVRAPTWIDVELPPHPIDSPLEIAVLELRQEMNAAALQIEITGDKPTKMCRMGDAAAGTAHRREQRDAAHDRDEVFRRNRKDEVEQDWSIRKIQRVGEENSVDRA